METLKLAAQERTEAGKDLAKLRESGYIPAVQYGHKKEAINLSVKEIDFKKVFKAAGESTLVELVLGDKKGINVLVHDVQVDPLSGRFTHIDFYQVNMNEEIETDIALDFVSEAPAVKALGGVLIKNLNEVKVKCLPKDLPHSLAIDLAQLVDFDTQIKVSDIKLPAGVEMIESSDSVVALVEAPRTEAEVAALDEKVDMDVTKVEGVVKEAPTAEGDAKKEEKK